MEFDNLFEECKKNFTDGMKKNLVKDESCISFRIDNENDIMLAIKLAYNDTKRTLRGWARMDSRENIKRESFKKLAKAISKYFSETEEKTYLEFAALLRQWRKILIDEFKSCGFELSTGQAQKIVNVTMKNLYCYNDACCYENKFKYCHMPLDSYILDWFRDILPEVKNKSCEELAQHVTKDIPGIEVNFLRKGSATFELIKGREKIRFDGKTAWSAIQDDDFYDCIQSIICFYLQNNNTYEKILLNESSLKTEFVIWPYMIFKVNLGQVINSTYNFDDTFMELALCFLVKDIIKKDFNRNKKRKDMDIYTRLVSNLDKLKDEIEKITGNK